ncbi:MAG: hypothetical protein L6R39_007025 [Caloplaca ligustica]|nr:MAG: hypothetical protein L6R39_007025 [Caloplaca ligustica]
MSVLRSLPRSTLYQNEDRSIALVDIPTSISEAQGTAEYPSTDLLHSSHPLEEPYQSIEPRSQKAKDRVQARFPPNQSSEPRFPQNLLVRGLAEVRAQYPFGFCLERKVITSEPACRKRKRSTSGLPQPAKDSSKEPETGGYGKEEETVTQHPFQPREPSILPHSATSSRYEVAQIADIANRVVSNPFPQPAQLNILDLAREYKVPPFSTFMLSKVGKREAQLFSRAAHKFFPEPSMSAAPAQFDFVLLDPPWDNKSARRSRHYSSGRRADEDLMEVLQDILGGHIAPGGLIACWITNKHAVRETALRAFKTWNVGLVEEWAWLKTTVHGDPIGAIDGIVRRPYETLLIGRAADVTNQNFEVPVADEPVRYRLIIGVPDLHSRKPSLKALIEPMMEDNSNYRALEIFARNLTAGWWSWGDEVLKYNEKSHWTKIET